MTKQSNDIFGLAYMDYFVNQKKANILVECSVAEPEKLPISYFFRSINEMPEHEKTALKLCRGSILDVGAGAGCHSLELQKQGFNVKAIDSSAIAVEVMSKRGVKQAVCTDIFSITNQSFDTILMLMNGIGIVKTLEGLDYFFVHMQSLLNEGGQIIIESSDISYVFIEKEIDLRKQYYGEVVYSLSYKDIKGVKLPWLYVDYYTLKGAANQHGFSCDLIFECADSNFLVRIYRNT